MRFLKGLTHLPFFSAVTLSFLSIHRLVYHLYGLTYDEVLVKICVLSLGHYVIKSIRILYRKMDYYI